MLSVIQVKSVLGFQPHVIVRVETLTRIAGMCPGSIVHWIGNRRGLIGVVHPDTVVQRVADTVAVSVSDDTGVDVHAVSGDRVNALVQPDLPIATLLIVGHCLGIEQDRTVGGAAVWQEVEFDGCQAAADAVLDHSIKTEVREPVNGSVLVDDRGREIHGHQEVAFAHRGGADNLSGSELMHAGKGEHLGKGAGQRRSAVKTSAISRDVIVTTGHRAVNHDAALGRIGNGSDRNRSAASMTVGRSRGYGDGVTADGVERHAAGIRGCRIRANGSRTAVDRESYVGDRSRGVNHGGIDVERRSHLLDAVVGRIGDGNHGVTDRSADIHSAGIGVVIGTDIVHQVGHIGVVTGSDIGADKTERRGVIRAHHARPFPKVSADNVAVILNIRYGHGDRRAGDRTSQCARGQLVVVAGLVCIVGTSVPGGRVGGVTRVELRGVVTADGEVTTRLGSTIAVRVQVVDPEMPSGAVTGGTVYIVVVPVMVDVDIGNIATIAAVTGVNLTPGGQQGETQDHGHENDQSNVIPGIFLLHLPISFWFLFLAKEVCIVK